MLGRQEVGQFDFDRESENIVDLFFGDYMMKQPAQGFMGQPAQGFMGNQAYDFRQSQHLLQEQQQQLRRQLEKQQVDAQWMQYCRGNKLPVTMPIKSESNGEYSSYRLSLIFEKCVIILK